MAGPSSDRITEWEGGSLSELVSILQAAALPVRIEVIAPGTTDSNAGEVHLLAGGLADAFAGSLRRDDAMAALQRLEGARFVVESRLPDPQSGSLSEPGPREGSLNDRSLASLMRYCEEYVLTCRLEVWRGQDRAVISYQRGEIIGTVVGGSEGSDRLPEVMAWTEGAYEIILPAPVLPPHGPSRKREGMVAGARPERKRHTTLPMMPGTGPKPQGPGGPRIDVGTPRPPTGAAAAAALPPWLSPPQPVSPAIPSGAARPAAPVAAARAASQQPAPQQPAARQPALPQPPREQPGAVAAKAPVRQPPPGVAAAAAMAARFAEPLQPEMTTRGTPPVPAVPLVPTSAHQPAPRPTMQGIAASPLQPKPATRPAPSPGQVPPKPAAPPAQAPAQPALRPAAISAQPPAKPAASLAQAPPKPAAPPAQVPPKPAAPPAQVPPKPAAPPAQPPAPSSVALSATQPPAQFVPPAEMPQAAHARTPKPSPTPAASNDLKPASGIIEAKPKHANHLPPAPPPIQVADEPLRASTEQPSTPINVPTRHPIPPRARVVARKGVGEHPVRVYVFVGLAIGVGIVLAYWAYWYLPFGHL